MRKTNNSKLINEEKITKPKLSIMNRNSVTLTRIYIAYIEVQQKRRVLCYQKLRQKHTSFLPKKCQILGELLDYYSASRVLILNSKNLQDEH